MVYDNQRQICVPDKNERHRRSAAPVSRRIEDFL